MLDLYYQEDQISAMIISLCYVLNQTALNNCKTGEKDSRKRFTVVTLVKMIHSCHIGEKGYSHKWLLLS